MDGLYSAAATVCASSIIAALLSRFITDGSTKKLISLVIGAFVLCCLIVPVGKAASDISSDLASAEATSPTVDSDSYNRAVFAQTKANLEQTLADILAQNGIKIIRCEVILALRDENRVIISSVTVYIKQDETDNAGKIRELTVNSFNIAPQIVTE